MDPFTGMMAAGALSGGMSALGGLFGGGNANQMQKLPTKNKQQQKIHNQQGDLARDGNVLLTSSVSRQNSTMRSDFGAGVSKAPLP